jgi:hypothetical protein
MKERMKERKKERKKEKRKKEQIRLFKFAPIILVF